MIDRKPTGYIQMNDGVHVYHGPVKSIIIDSDDNVYIEAKWLVKMNLGDHGVSVSRWEVDSNEPVLVISFPNLLVPFVYEESPEKGERVRFGINIIYFEYLGEIGPDNVPGLCPTEP